MARRKTVDAPVREQRLKLQREIETLLREQQEWFDGWVKPAAAEAKTVRPSGKIGEARPLPIDQASRLDPETATGRFEIGRANIEALSSRIRSLRTQEAKLAREITKPPPRTAADWTERMRQEAQKILEHPPS